MPGKYKQVNIRPEDQQKFRQICTDMELSDVDAFHHIVDVYNSNPQVEIKEVVKEIEKPLQPNQYIVTLSEEVIEYKGYQPNADLLTKYKLTDLNELVNAALIHFLKQLK